MKFSRTCQEAHRMVAESLDRDLPLVERLQLRLHLSICDNCTHFKKQMLVLRKVVRKLGQDD
jgi:hypothetical protein